MSAPISFPVSPAVCSASCTARAVGVKVNVTLSRTLTLKRLSLAPRFFAMRSITRRSSSESSDSKRVPGGVSEASDGEATRAAAR